LPRTQGPARLLFGPLPSGLRFYCQQQSRSGTQQIGNPPLPPTRSEQPPNALQKLIRLGAIGVMMLIGHKGVHASPQPTAQPTIRVAQIAALNAANADLLKLTESLLERNPSWAGSNARKAVAEAVQSIAQGASEGDKRLQQALGHTDRKGPQASSDCLSQSRRHSRAA
jgi:hypothetical protein